MTSIGDIPVHTEFESPQDAGSMLEAIINELLQLMDNYLATGQQAAIDVKSLPLSPQDYQQLQQTLGRGEVNISARLAGDTDIYETAYAGVWWITHRNMDNTVIAEHIEVGRVPDIVNAHDEDIRQARQRLIGDRARSGSH